MEFTYEAKNRAGQLLEGKIEAASEDQAVTTLHQKDLIILSLVSTQKDLFSKDLFSFLNRTSQKDVIIFTRQLATLVEADVPLVEGLHTLARQIEKASFRNVVGKVASAIEGGASLSVALFEHKKIFGPFYISLVKSGEVSGNLQSTLLYMADYLEKSSALNSKIKGALSYPAFVLFAIVVVSIIMMTTVLPQLLSIIKDTGATELPLSTRAVITVTGFVNNYIILILLALASGIVYLVHFIKTPGGRKKFDRFMISMPRFGGLIRNFYISRLTESLSTLIKAGVPILEGLKITGDIVGNSVFQEILEEAGENVRGGGTISEIFAAKKEFPPLVSSMLAVGEKTGRTNAMLDNIHKFYKEETENSVQNLTQLIEPVLILFLGLAVGVLVAAVLLPIYSLISVS